MTPRKLYVACWGEIVANDFRPATIEDAETGRKLWVSQEDYAALAAENERLRVELKAANNHIKANSIDPASINADGLLRNQISLLIDDLKAENERMRKAGDAMASALAFEYRDSPKLAAWLAAKEGRDAK